MKSQAIFSYVYTNSINSCFRTQPQPSLAICKTIRSFSSAPATHLCYIRIQCACLSFCVVIHSISRLHGGLRNSYWALWARDRQYVGRESIQPIPYGSTYLQRYSTLKKTLHKNLYSYSYSYSYSNVTSSTQNTSVSRPVGYWFYAFTSDVLSVPCPQRAQETPACFFRLSACVYVHVREFFS